MNYTLLPLSVCAHILSRRIKPIKQVEDLSHLSLFVHSHYGLGHYGCLGSNTSGNVQSVGIRRAAVHSTVDMVRSVLGIVSFRIVP